MSGPTRVTTRRATSGWSCTRPPRRRPRSATARGSSTRTRAAGCATRPCASLRAAAARAARRGRVTASRLVGPHATTRSTCRRPTSTWTTSTWSVARAATATASLCTSRPRWTRRRASRRTCTRPHGATRGWSAPTRAAPTGGWRCEARLSRPRTSRRAPLARGRSTTAMAGCAHSRFGRSRTAAPERTIACTSQARSTSSTRTACTSARR
mmetsp:Transcript_79344/g.237749  ORF Transcript_79344/g.237749 Transcript_79344/m.237749 type:complete len:211 (-) Transcript_79344:186-818(-)